jgi:hypothetical protein
MRVLQEAVVLVTLAIPLSLRADIISIFDLTATLPGGTASGTVNIDVTTGIFRAANITVTGPLNSGVIGGTLVFSGAPLAQEFDSFSGDEVVWYGVGGVQSYPGQPYDIAFEIPSAVGYNGGSISNGAVGMAISRYSNYADGFTSGSLTPITGTVLNTNGGSSSAPPYLISQSPIGEVTGTIAAGGEDYYSFWWGGGQFSATAFITGANYDATYILSEGLLRFGCDSGSAAILDDGNDFSGSIRSANVSSGEYCIGIKNYGLPADPSFELIFNTPLPASPTPEPSGLVLLVAGLGTLGARADWRNFGKLRVPLTDPPAR